MSGEKISYLFLLAVREQCYFPNRFKGKLKITAVNAERWRKTLLSKKNKKTKK